MNRANPRLASGFRFLLAGVLVQGCATQEGSKGPAATVGEAKDGVCVLELEDAGGDGGSDDADASTAAPVVPNSLPEVGCTSDFNALASVPMDASLSGAQSGKVVLDTLRANTLYFQNTKKYPLHWNFVSKNVPDPGLAQAFEQTQYFAPESDRRFLLGAVTHYLGPDVWALELAAYDTATASMIKKLFDAIKAKAFYGPPLRFHPMSQIQEKLAAKLDPSVPVITTATLYGSIKYQPLTLATARGQLLFFTSEQIQSGTFVPHDAIVVLDKAPNNISVVAGIISEEFQSPLSHINVLATNRSTPNMGLRGAWTNPTLRELEGKWVELTTLAEDWPIHEVTAAQAKVYTDAKAPSAVELTPPDTSIRGLWNVEDVVAGYKNYPDASKRQAIRSMVPSFGGKTVNYSVMAQTSDIPVPKAFAIPVYYYDKFMRDNGLYDEIDRLMADSAFKDEPSVRMEELRKFRNRMMKGAIDPELQSALKARLVAEYTGKDGKPLAMRFRTSTNSEDLEEFPCAGCYESHTGDPSVSWEDVLTAIRLAYSSIWLFRTYEERAYYGVNQKSVGMALLVHHTFQNETANGVAVTNNPFDTSGLNGAFYINVEYGGEAEVVHLPPGVTTDQFIYYYGTPNNAVQLISSSNLIPEGTTVLTAAQAYELGTALEAIHQLFKPAYGKSSGYAMDVEFKFAPVDATGHVTSKPALWVKQARPYPGRGSETINTSND